METDNLYINNALDWLKRAVDSLVSHKRTDEGTGFIRSSKQIIPEQKEGIFYTATFQAYSALLESAETYEAGAFGLKEMTLELTHIFTPDIFGKKDQYSTNNGSRPIILLGQILKVMVYLQKYRHTIGEDIINAAKEAIDIETAKTDILSNSANDEYYYPEASRSPWFLLSLLNCQKYIETIYGDANGIIKIPSVDTLIDSHINYHMARYNVKELSFDPISLVIALCCKITRDPGFKTSPFCISCLEAIVKLQHNDGCWPTGATISFDDSGDVIQQASIQIASQLAEAIIDYKFLVDCNDNVEQVLDIIIPSFRKLFNYITATFEKLDNPCVYGWSSDRIKLKGYTETWITAYTCRFLYKYWLAEKAYARIKALKRLGVTNYVYDEQNTIKEIKRWNDEIIEPDHILKPKETIDGIIQPIIGNKEKGCLLLSPQKDNISFIICGPPGSGKTYIVKQMAKALGWPLVELSPSHFIKKGLDFIESTSREIFNDLYNLHHAVVFFDECDELFRNRSESGETTSSRTILNFLTASMLPKLQDLHDKQNIIFVLGTNYLHNIDSAVRRKGRFDHRILFDRPDEEARRLFYRAKGKSNDSDISEDEFVKRTETALVKDLTKALSSSYQQEEDQSYLDWCGAKGEDSEGLLELKNCDKSECHQEKIKEWNKMLKENRE